jgi:hypothetical protein
METIATVVARILIRQAAPGEVVELREPIQSGRPVFGPGKST